MGDGHVRLEVRGLYVKEKSADLDLNGFPVDPLEDRKSTKVGDIQGGVFDLLASYGLGERSELGAVLPVFVQSTDFDGASSTNDVGIGDVVFYGKFKRQVATNCSMAGGLELELPTGSEKKSFGTGELGFNPFISSRYQRGPFAAGEERRLPPGAQRVDPLLRLAARPRILGVHVDAVRAPVDLRGADLHQLIDRAIDARLLHFVSEMQQSPAKARAHIFVHINSRLHLFSFFFARWGSFDIPHLAARPRALSSLLTNQDGSRAAV